MKQLLFTILSILLSIPGIAQPSTDAVIRKIQVSNPQVYKVECGERKDIEAEGGTRSYYPTKSFSYAQGNKISKVVEETQVYEGFELKETQLNSTYFIGLTPPDEDQLYAAIGEIQESIIGPDYNNIVKMMPEIRMDKEAMRWRGYNALEIPLVINYSIKENDGKLYVRQILLKRTVTLFRSENGTTWDPNANILDDGKWILTSNIVEMGAPERTVQNSEDVTQEAFDALIPAKDAWRYPETFSAGDRVEANINNRWFGGKVVMTDDSDPNKFYIFFDDGDKMWLTKDQLRLRE